MSHASSKHIIIIGAGPGGLTSAMLLAARGFKVTVFEKKPHVGGRNAAIKKGPYTFDTGPTFLMLKDILDEVFEEADRKSEDYLTFKRLEPMYRLQFDDNVIEPATDRDAMKAQIEKAFPGQSKGLDNYFATEKKRFDLMYPCLQKDYSSLKQMLSKDFRKALPHLSIGRTLMNVLSDYFKPEKLQLSFTFQAKYLGMSPWECPGAFGILSYIEHAFGVYHTEGGLSVISDKMAEVVKEHGGEIHLNTPVKKLLLERRSAKGVILENGETINADEVIFNADFAHAMTTLVDDRKLKKWNKAKLDKKSYSCSTFMLYLGLDKLYDMPHHTIVFANDYRKNVNTIFKNKILSNDVSVYIRNASLNDPTLAPKGHSAIYVLVPVPNETSGINWEKEKTRIRRLVLDRIKSKTIMTDIEDHIKEEHLICPPDWVTDYDVYNGATFNIGHTLSQMLYFRPRNKFEEFKNCWLVGGGTHPGSGLPTIYESGRISANLISRKYKIDFKTNNLQA